MFKNCTLLIDCVSEINSTKEDNVKHLDVILGIYSLIEYSSSYAKTSGSLGQYCRDEPNDNRF